jgi:hypothetical protein
MYDKELVVDILSQIFQFHHPNALRGGASRDASLL